MTRNTLSKKDLRELRKAAGGSPGGRRAVLLLASFTIFVLLGILGFSVLITAGGGNGENFRPNAQGLLPVGSQAPNFTAETVDGDSVSLGDADGKGETMLFFFASWCPHCNREAPTINELEKEYGDLRVIMVGVDGRDDSEKVRRFVDEYGIEGPAIHHPPLGRVYRTFAYPTIYITNSSGEIVAAHSGEVPKGVLEGWVEEALDNSDG
jgi:thiol-disulfide isomerase/thioredoxin